MDLVVTMTEHHIWLLGQMIDCASSLDDAGLDEPIELVTSPGNGVLIMPT